MDNPYPYETNTTYLDLEDDLLVDYEDLVGTRCELCGEYLIECECNEYDNF